MLLGILSEHHFASMKTAQPGVNFTIILQAAFTLADTESVKKTVKSNSFLRF